MTNTRTDIWSSLLNDARELRELKRELHGGYSADDEEAWAREFAVAEKAVSLLQESSRYAALEDRARALVAPEQGAPEAHSTARDEPTADAYTVKLRDDHPSLITNVVKNAEGKIVARGHPQSYEWEYPEDARAEQARLVEFTAQANRAEAAQEFMTELLHQFEVFGRIGDAYGQDTLIEVMYLQDAILNGTFHDYYGATSRLMEVIEQLPSAERWFKSVSVVDALMEAKHDPAKPEEIWVNYRRVFSGEEGAGVAMYNNLIDINGRHQAEYQAFMETMAAEWRLRPFEPGDLFELRSHGVLVAQNKFCRENVVYVDADDVNEALARAAVAQSGRALTGSAPDLDMM